MAGAYAPTRTVTLGGQRLLAIPNPATAKSLGVPAAGATIDGTFKPLDSGLDFIPRDVPMPINNFERGSGFTIDRDGTNQGGVAWLEDGIGWLGALMPSGRRTALSGAGLSLSGSALNGVAAIDSVVFDGDLFVLTSGSVMFKIPDCDPTQAAVYSPALDTFGVNVPKTSFRAGYVGKAICAFTIPASPAGGLTPGLYNVSDGVQTPALYVGTWNASLSKARLYQYTVVGGWVESNPFTLRMDKLEEVFWTGLNESVGAFRMCAKVDDYTVMQLIYGDNPLDETQWQSRIPVNATRPISNLKSTGEHLLVPCPDGLRTVNEIRSSNLTKYWAEDSNFENGRVCTLYDEYFIAARGFGLDRYPLALADQRRAQGRPGECGPGSFLDGTPIRGQFTALTTHDGWLLMALWNPENLTAYVGRARPKGSIDVPGGENPYVHYWSEQTLKPGVSTGNQITHLRVVSPTTSATTVAAQRASYMLMFTAAADATGVSAGFAFTLFYAPVPIGNGPLALRSSGGSFPVNSEARYYLTSQTWKDPHAEKWVRQIDLEGLSVTASSSLQVKMRANLPPNTMTTDNTWTSMDVATANSVSLIPSAELHGKVIDIQVVATTATPFTSPPLFQSICPRGKLVREDSKVRYLTVLLQPNKRTNIGSINTKSQDTVLNTVLDFRKDGKVAFTDENGDDSFVYVSQTVTFGRAEIGDNRWSNTVTLELSEVA